MISATTRSDLALLRKGKLNTSSPVSFEQLSGQALIAELRPSFPFVFLQRTLGRKQEIGMAREVSYEFMFRKLPESLFHAVQLHPALSKCFLISTYDDAISEITWVTRIQVRPAPVGQENPVGQKKLALTFRSGFKLDKTIDGWTIKRLRHKTTMLREEFLKNRGWQFDVLPPFGGMASVP